MSVVENRCTTKRKFVNLKFTWVIEDFSSCIEETGECLKSSTFSMGPYDKLKWNLQLFPKGECVESKDFLSLYIQLDSFDKHKPDVRTNIKLSTLNVRREETNTFAGTCKFVQLGKWGTKKFVRRDYLSSDLSPSNNLTINCVLTFAADIVNISSELNALPVPECRLSDDLAKLLESEKLSDVILLAGEREFKVHKDILAARSTVFSAMFEHEMGEQKDNKVEIADIDPEVLQEVLRFIYTGKAVNIEKMAADLLAAADKYMLDRLKLLCEETLCNNLSVTNATDLLILADRHSADQLMIQIINFIKMHAEDVTETPKWKSVSQSRIPISFHLVSELFRALGTQQHSHTKPLKISKQS